MFQPYFFVLLHSSVKYFLCTITDFYVIFLGSKFTNLKQFESYMFRILNHMEVSNWWNSNEKIIPWVEMLSYFGQN